MICRPSGHHQLSRVSLYDGLQRIGHPGVGIDGVELAGFDQAGQHRPVLRACIVTSTEGILSVQRDGFKRRFIPARAVE